MTGDHCDAAFGVQLSWFGRGVMHWVECSLQDFDESLAYSCGEGELYLLDRFRFVLHRSLNVNRSLPQTPLLP